MEALAVGLPRSIGENSTAEAMNKMPRWAILCRQVSTSSRNATKTVEFSFMEFSWKGNFHDTTPNWKTMSWVVRLWQLFCEKVFPLRHFSMRKPKSQNMSASQERVLDYAADFVWKYSFIVQWHHVNSCLSLVASESRKVRTGAPLFPYKEGLGIQLAHPPSWR